MNWACRSPRTAPRRREGGGGRFGGNLMAIDRVIIEGPLTVEGISADAEPRAHLHLPPDAPPGRDGVRREDPVDAGAPCLSSAGHADRKWRRSSRSTRAAAREGGDFDSGIQYALERLLVSPNFLLRVERDPASAAAGAPYRDQQPRAGVAAVVLPLEQHSGRRAAERRGGGQADRSEGARGAGQADAGRPSAPIELITNFAAQWLYLRDLKKLVPDPAMFPIFNDNLRQAFLTETEMFLENEMREDRPVPQLLTANYTFVNEQLAKFYGISQRLSARTSAAWRSPIRTAPGCSARAACSRSPRTPPARRWCSAASTS